MPIFLSVTDSDLISNQNDAMRHRLENEIFFTQYCEIFIHKDERIFHKNCEFRQKCFFKPEDKRTSLHAIHKIKKKKTGHDTYYGKIFELWCLRVQFQCFYQRFHQ